MKTFIFSFVSLMCCVGFIHGQGAYEQSAIITIPKQGTIKPQKLQEDWAAFVFNVEAPFPGTNSYRNFLESQKLLIPEPLPQQKAKAAATSESPLTVTSFQGNVFGGIPNDNDVAISNDGMIVSVCNSTFYVYHESSDSLWQQLSLNVFADSLDLSANPYDPRIEYDPIADRFVLVFLNGSSSSYSKIAVGFSQTNNPLDGWNMYVIEGNPFDDNAWSDFPAIALTDNELFLTLNHVNSDSVSWQTGFMRSVIWQINKNKGYVGDALESMIYSNTTYNGKYIRNLLPIKGGEGTTGPDMYFLSNRNFDLQNDTFFVVHIDNELDQSPVLTSDYIISDVAYGIPPNATQPNNTKLQTNDARPLGGFIQNGKIHFVGNTVHPTTNLCGVYHSIYEYESNPNACTTTILGGEDLEYGYPNISYTGYGFADNQAIIGFNHASIDSFAGLSAVFYDETDGYSDRIHIKSGNTNIGLISGGTQRWGDYTGNQRKYNNPSEVWISGMYAKFREFALPGQKNAHDTWIAGLRSQDTSYVSIEETEAIEFNSYPNPLENHLFISFNNPEAQHLNISIVNMLGQTVKTLLQDKVKSGSNVLHFSTEPLSAGNYLLLLTNQKNEIVHSEQIVK